VVNQPRAGIVWPRLARSVSLPSVRREAYKELGRRAGKASVAERKQKHLSTQPTLPVVLTKEAPTSSPSCTAGIQQAGTPRHQQSPH